MPLPTTGPVPRWGWALALLAMTAGCTGSVGTADHDAGRTSSTSGSATSSPSREPAYVDRRVRLGAKPCGIVATADRVWVSNYGDGTLQSIDRATGKVTYVGTTPTEKQPRGFAIDPKGKFLIASGEKSPTISVYAIDAATGALRLLKQYPVGKGANWVEIVSFD